MAQFGTRTQGKPQNLVTWRVTCDMCAQEMEQRLPLGIVQTCSLQFLPVPGFLMQGHISSFLLLCTPYHAHKTFYISLRPDCFVEVGPPGS